MADLADIARGLESGLSSFLTRQAREREEDRRKARERRREEEHDARMRQRRNRRTIQEADAASRGIELEGVETVDPGGPQAVGPEGRELDVTDVPRRGLEAAGSEERRRQESPVPILTGDESLMGEDQQLEGMAAGEGRLEPRAAPGADSSQARQALSEEFQRSARAGPDAEPAVEAGAIDPETGTFASAPVFRGEGLEERGPSIGSVLREGEVRQEDPTFRLSSGQRFTPGAEEQRILQEEVQRIMDARPDLSRSEAELLARGESQALTFGRGREETGLDETFNIRGREFRNRGDAVAAHRAFEGDRGGRGRGGGENLTQTETRAVQFGFTNPDGSPDLAGFDRFQNRVGSLQEVYGNTQGDPVLQKALEARAMGLSEREVLNRLTSAARERDFSDAQIQQLREDVRGFFSQRTARQLDQMRGGNLGPNFGSGFDLDFGGVAPDSTGAGGGGRAGGVGPLRGGGGGGR